MGTGPGREREGGDERNADGQTPTVSASAYKLRLMRLGRGTD